MKEDIYDVASAIAALHRAAAFEGIEPSGTLGTWLQSQETALLALSWLIEKQSHDLDERIDRVEAAMSGAGARVDAHIEKVRAETRLSMVKAAEFRDHVEACKENQKQHSAHLAKDLADGIRKSLIDVMHTREIRFNRRTNWGIIGTAASILVACFIAGNLWNEHRDNVTTVRRCETTGMVVDSQKTQYCRMDVVRG